MEGILGWLNGGGILGDMFPSSSRAWSPPRNPLNQLPLGMVRGAATGLMPEVGAAALQAENLSGMPAPKPSDYAAGVQKIVGGANAPQNNAEHFLSNLGESLPWYVATGHILPTLYMGRIRQIVRQLGNER
jgi:hypothetical protein